MHPVAVETTSSSFATAIASHIDQEGLVPRRGYVDVIAANPEEIPLAARTLPVFLLNGREGSTDPLESVQLPRQKSLFRRLSMLARVQHATPRHLVFVSSGDGQLVAEFRELWGEGFRARHVRYRCRGRNCGSPWNGRFPSLRANDNSRCSPTQAICRPSATTLAAIVPESLKVRIRSIDKSVAIVDASGCDLADQPILDRYELIRELET